MDILSLIGWRTEALEKPGSPRDLILGVGDRLQGRVSRLLSQNLALVDLLGGRYKAIAELKTPLNPGQRLNFKVTATTPQLILQVIQTEKDAAMGAPTAPPPGKASLLILTPQQTLSLVSELETMATALKGVSVNGDPSGGTPVKASIAHGTLAAADGLNAADAAKVATALERLVSHLAPLDLQGDLKATAAQLQAHVRDGGQLFLQKLVDAVQGQGLDPVKGFDQGRVPHTLDDSVPRELGDGAPKSAEALATRTAAAPMPQSHQLQADLKPHLQRLLIHLPTLMEALDPGQTLSTKGSRHLWSTVAALLDEMQSGQSRLAEQRPEDPPAVMRHSMWVEGRDEPLRLNVYLPRKRRKGDPATAPMVSLLLDLDRFGTVRVDVREPMGFHDQQQKLAVSFWMGSQAACDEMGAAVAPLGGILEALYPSVDLTVSLAPAKIDTFEQESGPAASAGSSTAKLDIRI